MPFAPDTFAGRYALITGASRGIGRMIALTLARYGADVALTYKNARAAAEGVADEIRAIGRDSIALRTDLESEEDIENLFQTVGDRFQGLDIFVSNAAATAFKDTLDLKAYNIDRSYAANLKAFVLASQKAAKLMEGRSGKIIAISSFGTLRCLPRYATLGSLKSALETWVRYLACELAPYNISVNAVNPGFVHTHSSQVYLERSDAVPEDHIVRMTPMQRLATPEDIAGVVAFLCMPEAQFIAGQTITVDGGLTLMGPIYPSFMMEKVE